MTFFETLLGPCFGPDLEVAVNLVSRRLGLCWGTYERLVGGWMDGMGDGKRVLTRTRTHHQGLVGINSFLFLGCGSVAS
jgi:hypothetical protein